jgi:hypothetical protein
MILFSLLALPMGSDEARAQGIPCDDYAAGGVVPFVSIGSPDRFAWGGSDRYRIFRSFSDDGSSVWIEDAADPFHPVNVHGDYASSEGGPYSASCYAHPLNDRRFRFTTWHSYGGGADYLIEIGDDGVTRFDYPFSVPRPAIVASQHYLWIEYDGADPQLFDATDLAAVTELAVPDGMVVPTLVLDDLALQQVGDVWTIVDLLDPNGPALRGAFSMPGQSVVSCPPVGDVLFLVARDDLESRLFVVDFGDLDHPVILSSIENFPDIRGFVVADGLMVSYSSTGIVIYDVADPSWITTLCGQFGVGEDCYQVSLRGHLLYARFTNSFVVYDISDPTSPITRGSVFLGGTARIYSSCPDLVAADRWLVSGEHFLHFDCNDPLPLDDEEQPDELPVASPLSITASQVLQRTPEIRFSLDRPGEADLSVYDLQGRRLAMLVSEVLPAGSHIVTWDGRDGSSRTQPAGVYLARLRLDDRTATCKLTLIR